MKQIVGIMANYIDGFVLPIAKKDVNTYQEISKQIAEVWKEYGALAYHEFIGDEMNLEGTRSFVEATRATKDEVIVFGWVVFESKEIRNQANTKVPNDPRMADLIAPLVDPSRLIFDAGRMMYGGFNLLV